MNENNKKGKLFLITTIIVCITSIYASLNGFNNNRLSGISWFILLGSLFISIVNLLKNRKEENSYYPIGNIILASTAVVCYVAPQIFIHM